MAELRQYAAVTATAAARARVADHDQRVAAAVGRREQLALLRVGACHHRRLRVDPLDAVRGVQRAPARVRARRVGAADAVDLLLGLDQRQVVGAEFEIQQHHVDIEEEVQVDVDDLQRHRRIAGAGDDAQLGDVLAAEQAHRRVGVAVAGRGPGAAALRPSPYRMRCTQGRKVTNSW